MAQWLKQLPLKLEDEIQLLRIHVPIISTQEVETGQDLWGSWLAKVGQVTSHRYYGKPSLGNTDVGSVRQRRGRGTCHQVPSPGPTWWEEENDPHTLSSELPMCTRACNKCNAKQVEGCLICLMGTVEHFQCGLSAFTLKFIYVHVQHLHTSTNGHIHTKRKENGGLSCSSLRILSIMSENVSNLQHSQIGRGTRMEEER